MSVSQYASDALAERAVTGSVLERLAAVNPNTELWWDSSPLVFETWREQMLAAAAPDDRPALADELLRLWDPDRPAATLFRGVTTNPPLSLAALRDDPARWIDWLRTYRQSHPEADEEQAFWAVYKEVVRNGAAALMPLHEASGYRYGHVSAQVDPRHLHDAGQMLTEALDLASIASNVMIKVPGTSEGMTVLHELTARGIATNTTLAYTVSQFVAAAEHVQAGLLTAREAGVDLTGWRSVITDMSVRWENAPDFEASATEHGVQLTPERHSLGWNRDLQAGAARVPPARLPEQDAVVLDSHRPRGRRRTALLAPRARGRRRGRIHAASCVPHRFPAHLRAPDIPVASRGACTRTIGWRSCPPCRTSRARTTPPASRSRSSTTSLRSAAQRGSSERPPSRWSRSCARTCPRAMHDHSRWVPSGVCEL